jgi:hypothetical protein
MEDRAVALLAYDIAINGRPASPDALPDKRFNYRTFDCYFDKKKAQFCAQPGNHFSSWQEADIALSTQLLRNWSSFSELAGNGRLTFTLRHYAYINRAANPNGPSFVIATLTDEIPLNQRLPEPEHISPLPPDDWQCDDSLDTLIVRWRSARDLMSSALSEAYYLVTVLKRSYGSDKEAAKSLNISHGIISTLIRFSVIDDPIYARKAGSEPKSRYHETVGVLSNAELNWIFRATQLILIRLASPSQREIPLTMGMLPTLPKRRAALHDEARH